MVRQEQFLQVHKSFTSLKNEDIPPMFSSLVSRRLQELENILCIHQPALLWSLQGEVFLESRIELT
jgi:hypothetical protein